MMNDETIKANEFAKNLDKELSTAMQENNPYFDSGAGLHIGKEGSSENLARKNLSSELDNVLLNKDLSMPIPNRHSPEISSQNDFMQNKTVENIFNENNFIVSKPLFLAELIKGGKNFISYFSNSKLAMGGGVAFCLLFALFIFNYENIKTLFVPTQVPILLADTSEVRQAPKQVGGIVIEDQEHSVYSQVLNSTAKTVQTVSLTDILEEQTALLPSPIIADSFAKEEFLPTLQSQTIIKPSIVEAVAIDQDENTQETTEKITEENKEEIIAEEIIATNIPSNIKPKLPKVKKPKVIKRVIKPVIKKGNYGVQLAAFRSRRQAKLAWIEYSNHYAGLLANYTPQIYKVDLVGQGIFYRLRVMTKSEIQAHSLCANIKAAGGDCFVIK